MVGRYDLVRARRLDPGDGLTLPRQAWVRVPPGFAESRWPTRPGLEAVCREDRPTGPLRIRRFPDRVTVRRERYHPGYHPARHLLYDRVPDGVLAAGRRIASGAGRVAEAGRRAAGGLGRLGAALGHGV